MGMLTDNEKLALELGLDLTPVVGDAKALFYDTPKNIIEGNYVDAALAAASSIPFLGAPADAARAARKGSDYLQNRASQKTQRSNTVNTAKKASDYLDTLGAEGKVLDYGAGLGKNAKAIKADDTFEPFPQKGFKPTFKNPSEVPANEYGKIISTNVINVLPPELRVEAILNIGKALKSKGKALIQTWSESAAQAGLKSKTSTPAKEPNAYWTSDGNYPTGFKPTELKKDVEEILGTRYTVETVPNKVKLSGTAVVVTKK